MEDQANRYFDARLGMYVDWVLSGQFLATDDATVAVGTLLGSCVSACIRDRRSGFGGMNHFLLPGGEESKSARHGVFAMELLINTILARGVPRCDLEAKVFGGAAVVDGGLASSVGERNSGFVVDFLKNEGIKILASDLGGNRGRRLLYVPSTGSVYVQYLSVSESRAASKDEARLDHKLSTAPSAGAVELFG